ncbi:ribonuclease H, partial [Trifolium medium]|nr:ribonuclease H [Trifolium medium]
WQPPSNGWVKLNSDGSCKENGTTGCGGLLRGCGGEWLGGFAKSIGECWKGSLMGRALVNKIRSFIALDWEVVVRHTYREANQCVDALANLGCSLNSEMCVLESCPT